MRCFLAFRGSPDSSRIRSCSMPTPSCRIPMWNRLRRRSQQFSPGSERGQALVLIALAFIGLAAFVGLTVDAGILFRYIGHLRRATDAASLAAANQFREGRDPSELSEMAWEMIELNGLTPLPLVGAVAKVCDLETPDSFYNDDT